MQEVGGFTIVREMLVSHKIVTSFKVCFSYCDLNEVKVWKELTKYERSVMFFMESQSLFNFFKVLFQLFHCPVVSKVVYN